MTLGILDPDQYYYSQVYMDAYRSVDVVLELSGKSAVFVEGGSQAGALATAVAAL
jgi:cephalosporin-C deacetylase